MQVSAARARKAAALAAALACIGTASAQATSCQLTDNDCVQREYSKVCFDDQRNVRLEACVAWLREIEQSPSTDVRSSAAGIYQLIGSHPTTTTPARQELRDQSAALIRGILDEEPNHADALLGLANLAETDDERVNRLRDVVAADPDEPRYLEFLARELLSIQGSELEVAALYERAYEAQMSRAIGPYAWRFARNAVWQYERAGASERAKRLRERVVFDYDLPARLDEVADATTENAGSLKQILQDLCGQVAMNVFGAKPCLDCIERAVQATDRARARGNAGVLEQTVSDAMFKAAVSGTWLDVVDSRWRKGFEAALERYDGPQAVARLRDVFPAIEIE
jgi:hypothetical protein